MMTTFLGLVAAVTFSIYAFPQMWTVWHTPRLRGYNLFSWCSLTVATTAILMQLALLHTWVPLAAQVINTVAVYYILSAVWRKG